MTITRNYHGGGTLTRRLCNLPKGGGADDRTKRGSRLSVPGGRLPFQRERDTSVHELARHQLGAGTGADDTGRQREIPAGQRGRRGRAHANHTRNAKSRAHRERNTRWRANDNGRELLRLSKWRSQIEQCKFDRRYRRRPAPQQHATLPRGVHLAADCLSSPGRGCAA